MTCTVAAVVAFLGYFPEPGEVVTIHKSQIVQYSPAQLVGARVCARRMKIRWRIARD